MGGEAGEAEEVGAGHVVWVDGMGRGTGYCEWTTRIWPIIAMDTVGQLFSAASYHSYRTHRRENISCQLLTSLSAEPYSFYQQHQQHPSHPPSTHSSPHPSPAHSPLPPSPHLFIQHPPPADIQQHDHREPDPPVDQIQDDLPLDEEPLYVNAKQYYRILKRRVARARMEEVHRLSRQRKVCRPRFSPSSKCAI